jgi:RNA polymerase sigma-70 factor (ECF subfamily)
MKDPGMPVLQIASNTSRGRHDTNGAPASRPPGIMDPEVADATVRDVYRENAPFVLSYVTGLLGDRHLAEDVVQETMLRAWRHCGRFNAEQGSVRGWLLRVAHNIAMDNLRMRRARPTEIAESFAPEPQVEDHADTVVTALDIRQVLTRLSPSHRNVIEHMYLNGLTAAETAALLVPHQAMFARVTTWRSRWS